MALKQYVSVQKSIQTLHFRFSKGLVLEGIKIILENNKCTFNDVFYRQITGTAMGTTFAPTYATLTKFQEFILENWSRFLNDCQTPLDKNKVKPQEVLQTLNSVNEAIQFTVEFNDKEIRFLDILIKKDSSGI